jgi:aromatic ring hydroxylase
MPITILVQDMKTKSTEEFFNSAPAIFRNTFSISHEVETDFNRGFTAGYAQCKVDYQDAGYALPNTHKFNKKVLQETIKELKEENTLLRLIFGSIINDLPSRRDWLDPDLEKAAKDVLRYK